MAALDRTLLMTPEGVTHDLHLAGLGSRFAALLVDLVIATIVLGIIGSQAGDSFEGGVGTAVRSLLTFCLIFGYFSVFEAVWNGRTPGKRVNGLRVVSEQGGPIGVRRSAIRNLIRIVEWFPFAFLIGAVAIVTSGRSQRLGDAAAGTYVIVEPSKMGWWRRRRAAGSPAGQPLSVAVPLDERQLAELMTWDVSRIRREETGVVLQFLDRRSTLEIEARQRLATQLAQRIRPRVVGVAPQIGDERFLELLARAKQHRR
jgi:uncharacterized RDD family membrane protein YckC